MRRPGLAIAGLVLAAFAVGCAGSQVVRPDGPQVAAPPAPAGAWAELASAFAAEHGEEASGTRMLADPVDALRFRLALADHAVRSLDVQYFLWHNDAVGNLLTLHLLDAADRGVRIRVLVDDLLLESDDIDLEALSLHPNLEVRVFNPTRARSSAPARIAEFLFRFPELNQRMHNKLMVADGHAAIVGGRNIGNTYFGLGERFNFLDLDLLTVGPAAQEVNAAFDAYWNDPGAHAIRSQAPADSMPELRRHATEDVRDDAPRLVAFDPPDAGQVRAQLPQLHPGRARVVWDSPLTTSPTQVSVTVMDSVAELARGATREVLIDSAYFIPNEGGVEELHALTERGVRVAVRTNSLGSNDQTVSNSGYGRYRRPTIEAGCELYELRWDAALKADADVPPTVSGYVGFHNKAIVVDRERLFVGSLNLDPRSIDINSEMGIIVDDPVLANEVADWIEEGLSPDNSWRVGIEDDALFWESSAGRLDRQPAKSAWERIQDGFFRLLPLESQL